MAALPVYLSGCKEMLVLVGPTYCSRLWCATTTPRHTEPLPGHHRSHPVHRCVIELFTWATMGGAAERVRVAPLPLGEGDGDTPLEAQLASFDALNAQCFKPDERQRLLGIIEEAFGDFGVFNAAVRSILTQRSQAPEEQVVQQV